MVEDSNTAPNTITNKFTSTLFSLLQLGTFVVKSLYLFLRIHREHISTQDAIAASTKKLYQLIENSMLICGPSQGI
ncbi:unnamed protein product [Acanthoscelides obtectus]|uniref:Uncharacterized protein n=1 Tax=Acanthoscelides obtectus TaxID=200917 RepID=A0A9P0JIS6_ACAOB|nr:unnamed protein product [Acanthoscelides obtectus]CAK1639741.1 hypothetical protein AOBTE_LOCUS11347 [Acanthoscelides obtectus]